jgi:FixJ family two-component response regulator
MTKNLLVAVIDDDASVLTALRRLLGASGLEPETFASGQPFLDSLPAHRPDCMVLDFHMPGLTGLDVLRELDRRVLQIPVVVITGRCESGSEAQCQAVGALAYLSKPIDNRVLLEAIGEAVGHRLAQS